MYHDIIRQCIQGVPHTISSTKVLNRENVWKLSANEMWKFTEYTYTDPVTEAI